MKMSWRAILAGIAGLALVVGMTLGAWAIVGGSLNEPVRPVRAPGDLAPSEARSTPSVRAPSPSPSVRSPRPSASPSPSDDDRGRNQRGKGSGRSGGDD